MWICSQRRFLPDMVLIGWLAQGRLMVARSGCAPDRRQCRYAARRGAWRSSDISSRFFFSSRCRYESLCCAIDYQAVCACRMGDSLMAVPRFWAITDAL
jgi:hypothetical protein